MKKTIGIMLLMVIALLFIGCPQPTDGGEKGYVKPANETITIDEEGSSVTMEIIGIKGGTFTMGSKADEVGAADDEKPQRAVTLDSFMLGSTEVTEAQWMAVMAEWPQSNPDGGDTHPARILNWYDAIRFCNKLSMEEELEVVYTLVDGSTIPVDDKSFNNSNVVMDKTKNGYRLPTEAEWEYAAGGAQGMPTKWAGTNDQNVLSEYAVYGGGDPSAVIGSRKPVSDTYALYDMSGNVSEWCWDWYNESYYQETSAITNPVGPDSGTKRIYRGGFSQQDLMASRIANRNDYDSGPTTRSGGFGFRVARSVN